MDNASTARRLKAARQLADPPLTVEELAAKLSLPGLGYKTLGNIERGDREIRPHEIQPIADALGVPATFLTGLQAAPAPPDGIEQRVAHIEAQLDQIIELLKTSLNLPPETRK